jgi:hypothetical protein
MVEDLQLQVSERWTGLKAQLSRQDIPCALIHLQRVGLSSATVQSDHQPPDKPLMRGMLRHELLELRHQLLVTTERQPGVGASLKRLQTQLLQAADLRLCEILESDLRQRRPAPQREGPIKRAVRSHGIVCFQRPPTVAHRRLKHLRVQLTGLDAKHIAAPDRAQPLHRRQAIGRERLAQTRDRHRQPLVRTRSRRPPDRLAYQVTGHRPIGVQQQKRKQAQLPRTTDGQPLLAIRSFDRPKDPKTRQTHTPVTRNATESHYRTHAPMAPSVSPTRVTARYPAVTASRDLSAP